MIHQTSTWQVDRPVRRGPSVAGLAAVTIAGLTAMSWLTHSQDRVTVDQPVTRVEVDVSAGHVDITGSPAGETSFEFETKTGWVRDGGVTHRVENGTLWVDGGCDSGVLWGLWCKSDLSLTVPADAEVVVRASAGSIAVRGLAGATDLESSAGSIVVEDQTGDLIAHSAAGSVDVDGLDTEVGKVTSSAGSVDVRAVRPPLSLDAESSAGDVRVSVPDEVSYDVETDSSIGDETVTVRTLSGAGHEIRAFSSAGSVEVTAR